MKKVTKTTELRNLEKGTWFSVEGDPIKYKREDNAEQDELDCIGSDGNYEIFYAWQQVTKVDGLALYLLQGGRDWD